MSGKSNLGITRESLRKFFRKYISMIITRCDLYHWIFIFGTVGWIVDLDQRIPGFPIPIYSINLECGFDVSFLKEEVLQVLNKDLKTLLEFWGRLSYNHYTIFLDAFAQTYGLIATLDAHWFSPLTQRRFIQIYIYISMYIYIFNYI